MKKLFKGKVRGKISEVIRMGLRCCKKVNCTLIELLVEKENEAIKENTRL